MRPLRPYQSDAVERILAELKRVQSTLLVLPTGMGKTRIASEVIKRWHHETGDRCLFLAHREELIDQAEARITEDSGLVVSVEKAERRAVKSSTPVVVGCVPTMRGRRLKMWDRDAFGLVITDEAHHAAAMGYQTCFEWFRKAKHLGVTATPDRTDKKGLASIYESVAYTHQIEDAIDEKYLCPIVCKQVFLKGLNLSDVKTRAGDLSAEEIEGELDKHGNLHEIAAALIDEARGKRTIVFMPGVATAQKLAEIMAPYCGDPHDVQCVHGGTPKDLRRNMIKSFREGGIRYLISCMVLTEGFDCPEVQCIGIVRPTKSRSLYVQMVGRGLRIAEGKTDLLLLDFQGISGRHKLICPEDILGEHDDSVKERIREYLEKGCDLQQAVKAANAAEQEEREEREAKAEEARRKAEEFGRWKAEQEAIMRESKRIFVKSNHETIFINPFTGRRMTDAEAANMTSSYYTASHPDDIASPKQVQFLMDRGVPIPDNISKRAAGKLIQAAYERPTLKMIRVMSKFGLSCPHEMAEAKAVMDRIAQNGWRVPADIQQKYGAR